jgi:hypothetical protein
MQIGVVELHGARGDALEAWAREAGAHFRTRDGGCSARPQQEPPALFFTLPDGRAAVDAFVAHVEGIDRAGRARFLLQDEDGVLRPVEA